MKASVVLVIFAEEQTIIADRESLFLLGEVVFQGLFQKGVEVFLIHGCDA